MKRRSCAGSHLAQLGSAKFVSLNEKKKKINLSGSLGSWRDTIWTSSGMRPEQGVDWTSRAPVTGQNHMPGPAGKSWLLSRTSGISEREAYAGVDTCARFLRPTARIQISAPAVVSVPPSRSSHLLRLFDLSPLLSGFTFQCARPARSTRAASNPLICTFGPFSFVLISANPLTVMANKLHFNHPLSPLNLGGPRTIPRQSRSRSSVVFMSVWQLLSLK